MNLTINDPEYTWGELLNENPDGSWNTIQYYRRNNGKGRIWCRLATYQPSNETYGTFTQYGPWKRVDRSGGYYETENRFYMGPGGYSGLIDELAKHRVKVDHEKERRALRDLLEAEGSPAVLSNGVL